MAFPYSFGVKYGGLLTKLEHQVIEESVSELRAEILRLRREFSKVLAIALSAADEVTRLEDSCTSGQRQPLAEKAPHDLALAGYRIACKYGVLEGRAFNLTDEMYSAFEAIENPRLPAWDGWVATVDCLPTEPGMYLVAGYRSTPKIHSFTKEGKFFGKREITHWMHLPPPPSGALGYAGNGEVE